MSEYATRMKGVLTSFNATAKRIRKDIERNDRDFLPDVTHDANAKLRLELNKAAAAAREQVDVIHADARKAVKKWAEPSGAEIDAADLKLLEGGVLLSNEALYGLLVKHQHSGTMVNAIAKYAREHGLTPEYIPNVEDKLYIYKSLAERAHSVISRVVGNIGLDDNDVVLSRWAERGNISQRAELVLYGIKLPEEAAAPKGDINFGFQHLPGR